MDRIINFKVTSSHLAKDSSIAGVRGEANSTILRIKFDESWDGYTKCVVFKDAEDKKVVRRILTVDLLEDMTADTRVYLCPIPAEPLAYEGKCEIAIEGYVDSKRIKSYSTQMAVYHSTDSDNADEPIDPTPTQAEQLQAQIESVVTDIQRAVAVADIAEEARATALAAQKASEAAAIAAERAEDAMATGVHASRHAMGGEDALSPADIGAYDVANVGKDIPNNADLNNYTTPGIYRSSGSGVSATLKNAPANGAGFRLVVEVCYGKTQRIQTAFYGTLNRRFTRTLSENVWSAWTEFAAVENTVNKAGDVMIGDLRLERGNYRARLGVNDSSCAGFLQFVEKDTTRAANLRLTVTEPSFQYTEDGDKWYTHNLVHAGNISSMGLAKIKHGSYVGNGSTDWNTINVGFPVKYIVIKAIDQTTINYDVSLVRGMTKAMVRGGNTYSYAVDLQWTDTGVRLYNSTGGHFSMNANAVTYFYFAIG